MSPASIYSLIKGRAVLAPMLATSDIPFRQLCKSQGAALTYTEMVSTQGVVRRDSDAFRNAVFDPDERPIAVQLLVWKADSVEAAIQELLPMKPVLFDINCGCPSDAVCDMGGGAELLDNPRLLSGIVAAAARACTVPVSVKIRAGGRSNKLPVRDVACLLEDSGASLLTVHGRSRNTPYDQPANWELIAQVKEAVSIPVIGNGDVFSSREAYDMMYSTGCDAVMVARGALGTPWIFRDIEEHRHCGVLDCAPEGAELHVMIMQHVRSMMKAFGSVTAVPRIRKHAMWYARFFPECGRLRSALFVDDDADRIMDEVDGFFAAYPRRWDEKSREFFEMEQRFRRRVLYWI
jgi:tRNA-dihydrouridine synthase B